MSIFLCKSLSLWLFCTTPIIFTCLIYQEKKRVSFIIPSLEICELHLILFISKYFKELYVKQYLSIVIYTSILVKQKIKDEKNEIFHQFSRHKI